MLFVCLFCLLLILGSITTFDPLSIAVGVGGTPSKTHQPNLVAFDLWSKIKFKLKILKKNDFHSLSNPHVSKQTQTARCSFEKIPDNTAMTHRPIMG